MFNFFPLPTNYVYSAWKFIFFTPLFSSQRRHSYTFIYFERYISNWECRTATDKDSCDRETYETDEPFEVSSFEIYSFHEYLWYLLKISFIVLKLVFSRNVSLAVGLDSWNCHLCSKKSLQHFCILHYAERCCNRNSNLLFWTWKRWLDFRF